MERLFYVPTAGPTTPPPHLAADNVWFRSADGTRLHGWFIPAAGGPRPRGAASVLHVHGNAGNIESHAWFSEFLPPAGFNVLIFDYRGYGRSGGRPRRREPLIADTSAALDALLARPDVDPKRIGMYGHSLGGAIGLNVMAKRSEIRAAVIMSAFSSWRDMAASAIGGGPVSGMLARLLIRDGARPDTAIARIDRPLLIIHGTNDSIVPVANSRRLASCAQHAVFVEVPGGDHNDMRDTHPEVDAMIIEFFRQHLAR
jgi:dipeptidyl aminopeptidase/acylaminoacyl peptidase